MKKPKPKITITALSEQSGLHRQTIRLRLKDAALYPPSGHSLKKLLDALKPDPAKESKTAYQAMMREKILEEKWRALKFENDRKLATLISRAFVCATVAKLSEKMTEITTRKLEGEYPVTVAGMDIHAAREHGKKLGDEIREEIRALGYLWGDN